MRLSDLNPKLTDTLILVFDCPVCSLDLNKAHRIRVGLVPCRENIACWNQSGEFPETLTLDPSIDAGCWHGHITNGDIKP